MSGYEEEAIVTDKLIVCSKVLTKLIDLMHVLTNIGLPEIFALACPRSSIVLMIDCS